MVTMTKERVECPPCLLSIFDEDCDAVAESEDDQPDQWEVALSQLNRVTLDQLFR